MKHLFADFIYLNAGFDAIPMYKLWIKPAASSTEEINDQQLIILRPHENTLVQIKYIFLDFPNFSSKGLSKLYTSFPFCQNL